MPLVSKSPPPLSPLPLMTQGPCTQHVLTVNTPRLSLSQDWREGTGKVGVLTQKPIATPQHRKGVLPLPPASQASQARTVRAQRPKSAGDSGCLREFLEKRAAISELILEVGPEAKSRGWKELPESASPSLSQLWGDFCALILGAGRGKK